MGKTHTHTIKVFYCNKNSDNDVTAKSSSLLFSLDAPVSSHGPKTCLG